MTEAARESGFRGQALPGIADLAELVRAMMSDRRLESLLGRILDVIRTRFGAESAAILLLDRIGRHLHLVTARSDRADPMRRPTTTIALYDAGLRPVLHDPHAFVALTGRTVAIEDAYAYSGFDLSGTYREDREAGTRTRTLLALPLRSPDNLTLGVIRLGNLARIPVRDGAGSVDMPVLEAMTSLCSIAVHETRLVEENRQLTQQLDRLATELRSQDRMSRVPVAPLGALPAPLRPVGDSPPFRAALELARRAASTRVPVLLLGETGAGKEVFARAIHALSGRKRDAFVVQNCAALPETLLESELFGHRKGAFTGATHDKAGLVQESAGGTLFLDEIGDMPPALQSKLLRLLQEGEVRPLGATKSVTVDIRVIAATNVDLKHAIEDGRFRADLFYRLNVFPILVPALRERPSDIPALVEHFLVEAARSHGRSLPAVTPRAVDALARWRYPGNVRELKNILERALLLVDDGERIDLVHLPPEIGGPAGETLQAPVPATGDLKTIMRAYETTVIHAKLRETGGNRTKAARLLNISRRSLVQKIGRG